jgi:sulfite reductase beta subunit-like hemoprotein
MLKADDLRLAKLAEQGLDVKAVGLSPEDHRAMVDAAKSGITVTGAAKSGEQTIKLTLIQAIQTWNLKKLKKTIQEGAELGMHTASASGELLEETWKIITSISDFDDTVVDKLMQADAVF